jgi:S1-C subfamily serine protease
MKNFISLFSILVILLFRSSIAQEINWFGKSTIYSTVLLQKKENSTFINHGTGILYSPDNNERSYVITCEHVLRNSDIYVVVSADSELVKKINSKKEGGITFRNCFWELDGQLLRLKINLIKDSTFLKYPNKEIDLGVFPIQLFTSIVYDSRIIEKFTKTTFVSDKNLGNSKFLKIGEEIYFSGFHFGLGTNEILSPIVRSGTISWVSENKDIFLLDAFSYGGNSGSPVFTKMSSLSSERNQPYLIGMVTGHIISPGNENIGLATCVSIQKIKELLGIAIDLRIGHPN